MMLCAGTYVPGAAERVQTVYSWVCQLIAQRTEEYEWNIPPPAIVNVMHLLSEGLFQFEMAR